MSQRHLAKRQREVAELPWPSATPISIEQVRPVRFVLDQRTRKPHVLIWKESQKFRAEIVAPLLQS